MTDSQVCPKCQGKMRLGRVRQHATFTEKRRDCDCGYGDKVHIRIQEEILAIIAVVKRAKPAERVVRVRTRKRTRRKEPRNNEPRK